MTPEQKRRRGPARLMADRFVKDIKARMDSLPAADRREVRRVLAMARDGRNAKAIVSMAHNAGVPGPLTIAQSLAGSIAVKKGWL